MNRSIFQEIKDFFIKGSILSRIIGVNVAIFLLANTIRVFFFLWNMEGATSEMGEWLGVSSNPQTLLYRPWTLITYMFFHFDLLHILFNMIVLLVGGRLFSSYIGADRLTVTYLVGGIAGAFVYILSFNFFPVFGEVASHSIAIGASASVLAVFIATATYMPNFQLPLLLFGRIRLKYIAIVFVAIDIISIDKGNPGGHLAHLGGALWGFSYGKLLLAGKDPALVAGFYLDRFFSLFRSKPKMRVEYRRERPLTDDDYNKQRLQKQKQIDHILDKISQNGYDSLSKEEKEMLFRSQQ